MAKYNISQELRERYKKGTKFLGCDIPIMGGAMTWVSEKNLVSAISNAGGFGIIACGGMEKEVLRDEIIKTKEMTKKPFGVNLILMHPDIEELMNTCVETGIKYVVFAGGFPKKSQIEKLKNYKIKTLAFATTLSIARKLIKNGIDALIIEGSEAGGHVGPVSTNVLVQEILPFIEDVPVFVAGGIGRGEVFLNYIDLGASGCQIGTRFVCAKESIAHKNFKDIFIR
jgi:enoyl-[acyl-carrier protein] reductase II